MTDEAPPGGHDRRVEASSSQEPVEEGAPSWVVTFGDMMSLLLTFFILLFSMSEVKVDRFLLASESLREAMGSTSETPTDNPMGLMPDPVDPELDLSNPGLNNGARVNPVDGENDGDDYLDVFADAYLDMIAQKLEDLIAKLGLEEGAVEVVTEKEGTYMRIRDAALFSSGEAALLPESRDLVRSLAEVTRELNVPTIVSGHADDRPINTAMFPSNWELSAARAAGVARLLVEGGQDPATVRAQSFGQYAPIDDNSTAEGRARNRRVELFFSRDAVRRAAMELAEKPRPTG